MGRITFVSLKEGFFFPSNVGKSIKGILEAKPLAPQCHRYLEPGFIRFSDSPDVGIEERKWVVMPFWLIGDRVFKTRRTYIMKKQTWTAH